MIEVVMKPCRGEAIPYHVQTPPSSISGGFLVGGSIPSQAARTKAILASSDLAHVQRSNPRCFKLVLCHSLLATIQSHGSAAPLI